MSAVSGLTSKGENKSKQKYQSLNINNLYKGKSLETQKTSVAPKHGLQTLGKVGAGRRMPPPANLPSLKSQITGNPNITLVPTGGQGWGSGKEEDSGATPPLQTSSSVPEIPQISTRKPSSNQSNPLLTSSSGTTAANVGAIASGLAAAALTAAQKTWSTVTTAESEECGPDKNSSAQRSPFFPQEFPKLDGGNVPQDATIKAGAETSYGPGPSLRPQTEGSWGRGTLPQQQPGFTPNANQPPNAGNGVLGQPSSPTLTTDPNMSRNMYIQQRPPVPGAVPIIPAANQTPIIPGQPAMTYPNQYRMVGPYPSSMAYPRGAYPSGPYPPQGFPPPPHGAMANPRQPYFGDGRVGQRVENETGNRPTRPPPPIITDKDLKGFDEILENDVQKGWAAANTEIDYNAKLVFSDDEDAPQRKSSNHKEGRERSESIRSKDRDRRDYDRDERQKYRGQQQWQHMPTNARPNNYDYSQHSSQSAQSYPRQPIHSNHSHSRHNRSEPPVVDEDEIWAQRSQQQQSEMATAVIRARQRREEDESKFQASKQAAFEKLRALEEKAMEREKDSIDFDQSSRHSSDSKDEKLSNRDSRDSRSSNYSNSFPASKQYPKNVPPRFQKQAELMRQTHQQSGPQTAQSPPFEQRFGHRLPSESDSRNISNNSQPPNKAPLIVDTSRSNSQISSGHESYDSEREGRTPEYESKDKRHRFSQSGSDSNNWRAVQTQRHVINDSKGSLDNLNLRSIDDKDVDKNQSIQRQVPKRLSEDLRENKQKEAINENKDNMSDKRNLVEKQENIQSLQSSDKRVSAKDDRHSRKADRLDWTADYETMKHENMISMNNYGQKRDHTRHRHVPITQKQFESISEPIKKNFTPLKKINSSNSSSVNENIKENPLLDKKPMNETTVDKDSSLKTITTAVNVSQTTKTIATDIPEVQPIKDESHVDLKKDRDTDRGFDKEKDSIRKDDKNSRKSSHSIRYDSYGSRGRFSGPAFARAQGREYRRTRGSSEKMSYNESKLISSPEYSRNKTSKSRRKSNSDDSCVSEDINKKESTKPNTKKSSSGSVSGSKDIKSEDESEKEKLLSSDTVITGSASSNPLPSQRNELSRRGRGVVAFKNSTRGLPRTYGPSNYGPPPSRAAFGDGFVPKSETNCHFDQNRNERNDEKRYSNDMRNSSSKSSKNEINYSSYSGSHSNQIQDNNRNSISNSRKTSVTSNRNAGNASNSANNRSEQLAPRFQKRNNKGTQVRGSRTRPERTGSGNQFDPDLNEEWETASESSDVTERSDRKSNKRNHFNDQRNDSRNQNRKAVDRKTDNPRAPHSGNGGNQSTGYRGGRNRNQSNNGSNTRSTNVNQQRNGPISGSNANENLIVCQLSEVTLDNPTAVEEAISRTKASHDLIDDQNSENEDGFQTVSYKKRNRLNAGNDSKKFKQELSPKSKPSARNRQSKLAPRFAKQKENIRLNTISDEAFTSTTKVTDDLKALNISAKDTDISGKTNKLEATSLKTHNAWSKPLSHSSQTVSSNTTITTTTKTTTNTTTSTKAPDVQPLSVSSKSSSFDQHDSGIDVSDQPLSTASSQRSSPSNDDNKVVTTAAKVSTPADTRTDIPADIDGSKPMCTVIFENTRFKEENKVLAKIAPSKSPSAKEMFANTSNNITNNVVTETSRPTQPITAPKKNDSVIIEEYSLNEKNQSSNVAKVVGMQRTNVLPMESDLNMKIASVKKVWETSPIASNMDTKNDNSKNVLLKTFDENKMISNDNHNSDVRNVKVTERTDIKVDYSCVDPMDSLNKSKPQVMTYSTPGPNQLSAQSYVSSHESQPSLISQQILLNTISSPPLAETLRSGVQQQFQVHNMTANPAISTPPTMLYNTHVAAHNVYQTFGPQIESLHQTQLPVMAQFGHHNTSSHYGQHLLQQHQQNQMNQTNIFMAHQLAQSSSDQYKFNAVAHQQSMAKSLLNNQFVHQNNSSLQQTLSTQGSWTTPTAHTQTNNQTANYYPQSSSVGSALQAHQQHFAYQSQQSLGLMSAQNQASQAAAAALVQQSYRANPLSLGRTPGVDAANPMAANLRSMFAGSIVNDMKIGGSVNQTLDTRNANNRNTFSYNQTSNLQQIPQQQQQMFANPKFTSRAILPVYAQQMLGQTALSGRPNSATMLSSSVNSANSYTTPIQRPKLNRNPAYPKNPHPTNHSSQHQLSHQSHQTTHPTHVTHAPHLQQIPLVAPQSAQLSTAQQAKMRQEAVRQTQSFFAQSSLPSGKSESQNESQICVEVSNETLNKECLNPDINEDKNNSIQEKTD